MGTIPLVIVIWFWATATGFIGDILYRDLTPSRETIGLNLLVDIPLILTVVGVWLSGCKPFLYLGRIGTIIWLLPFGVYSVVIFGELEHAEPRALVEYLIVLLSTIAVILSLWKREKKRGGT